uniref:Pre-mRNA-splicing factor 18 n=1 Tax=Glossina pallidipes TaxID=7398 RepID=A0A1B0A3S6_GLOPL
MVSYAQETQHEKILRGLAVGISLIMFARLEESDPLVTSLSTNKDPVLCRSGMYTMTEEVKPSDAYLVTMVVIHTRTGREKIFSKNVMNDETQPKYIQGLKKLMTKCQEYFPTDPSKRVEYGSKKDRE